MLGSLEFFEKGEQIPNKNNELTYLPSIGVALYEISEGARMLGAIEKSEIGKSMFKKFYPDKYDLFFWISFRSVTNKIINHAGVNMTPA